MEKVRVADYIADFVAEKLKVTTVFTVTGGGAMFLNDAFGNHSKLNCIYNHHEQASAMGAVGYAKHAVSFGVACFTTGCGSTNAITGVLDAWQDSTPLLCVSGQVKSKETTYNSDVNLRQFGVQEANIVKIVQSITKYAVMLNDPEDIAYELEKATFLGANGRPGPVWLDVPLDVQGAWIDPAKLKHYDPIEDGINVPTSPKDSDMSELSNLLDSAKRPIIIAGNGIRLSGMSSQLTDFIDEYKIPVTFSYLSIDLIPSSHPLVIGRLGAKGDRAGNFAVQNSDLVIVLGSRLSVALTGFEYDLFAREADVVVVDIDSEEHRKNTLSIDLMIEADLRNFFSKCKFKYKAEPSWLEKCQKWKAKWPVYQGPYHADKNINMYECISGLEATMPNDAVIVSDAGSAYYVTSQALQIKGSQRYITSGAQADMGYSLPASIGACIASNKKMTYAITGDGSFQMNIQELQTIIQNKLPIKIIILNNNGYLSIKTTQTKFFDGRLAGTNPESGLTCPQFEKIATAYDIHYLKAESTSNLNEILDEMKSIEGPVICEVICPEFQEVIPAVSSIKREDGSMLSKPIEDMYPFLDREEFDLEMIIDSVKDI